MQVNGIKFDTKFLIVYKKVINPRCLSVFYGKDAEKSLVKNIPLNKSKAVDIEGANKVRVEMHTDAESVKRYCIIAEG